MLYESDQLENKQLDTTAGAEKIFTPIHNFVVACKHCSMSPAESGRDRPVNEKRFADDVFFRHIAPISGIGTV